MYQQKKPTKNAFIIQEDIRNYDLSRYFLLTNNGVSLDLHKLKLLLILF